MERLLALSFLPLILLLAPASALSQGTPADLIVTVSEGGLEFWSPVTTVTLRADGSGAAVRTHPSVPSPEPLHSQSFTLSAAQVTQVWEAVQASDFFTLPADSANIDRVGGVFTRIRVQAGGMVHQVTTRNQTVEALQPLIDVLDAVTPAPVSLGRTVAEPLPLDPIAVCARTGKAPLWPATNPASAKGRSKSDLGGAVLTQRAATPRNGTPHAGTTVGSCLTLQEAVECGIATLTGKGEFFGDAVAITVDNTSNKKTDNLVVSLYLEFWGPAATPERVAFITQAIESFWTGKTGTDGTPLNLEVHALAHPGTGFVPIPTPGYHQIELIDDWNESHVDGLGVLNEDTKSGKWGTSGTTPDSLAMMYAHEAGHLLGLDDQYWDFEKQSDGSWLRTNDDTPFTVDELAAFLAPKYNDTVANLKTWLMTTDRATAPFDGHENDLMGGPSNSVPPEYVDTILAQAGVQVKIEPGDVLVSKDGSEQNLVITHAEDVFAKPGEIKTLEGLYGACIDHDKGIPDNGLLFDVAPPLHEWAGIQAAADLQRLVTYIDANTLYCGTESFVQSAIWLITDNSSTTSPSIQDLFAQAGIEPPGSTFYDFPRLTNPAPDDEASVVLLPRELYVTGITPRQTLAGVGQTVDLTHQFTTIGSLEGITTSFVWTLDAPPGSTLQPPPPDIETATLTLDQRGLYQVSLTETVSGAPGEPEPFTVEARAFIVAADAFTETFESATLQRMAPFYWRSRNVAWQLSDLPRHTGAFAARSGAVEDGEFSSLTSTVSLAEPAELSFAFKVSSEEGFDFLTFSVDADTLERWSGNQDWSVARFILPAGEHEVSWTYKKDGSLSAGLDAAWIDDVIFPDQAIFSPIEGGHPLPAAYRLAPSFPNPTPGETHLSYELAEPQPVSLTLYDVLGRVVAVLDEGLKPAGRHNVRLDAQVLPSGTYFYRLQAGSFTATRSLQVQR